MSEVLTQPLARAAARAAAACRRPGLPALPGGDPRDTRRERHARRAAVHARDAALVRAHLHGERAGRARLRHDPGWCGTQGPGVRRLPDTVLLDGLRCGGGEHGGCQAQCLLYWKEAWLRPAGDGARSCRRSRRSCLRAASRSWRSRTFTPPRRRRRVPSTAARRPSCSGRASRCAAGASARSSTRFAAGTSASGASFA